MRSWNEEACTVCLLSVNECIAQWNEQEIIFKEQQTRTRNEAKHILQEEAPATALSFSFISVHHFIHLWKETPLFPYTVIFFSHYGF